MKLPTTEEIVRNVVEKAIDEYAYKGKTLRQWIEIILATDINVATEHGTNLAEVGTDCISRQQAIDALNEYFARIGKLKRRGLTKGEKAISLDTVGAIKTLPPAEPKTGEWIHDGSHWANRWICDKCGYKLFGAKTKFCPDCGARMEVEHDEVGG